MSHRMTFSGGYKIKTKNSFYFCKLGHKLLGVGGLGKTSFSLSKAVTFKMGGGGSKARVTKPLYVIFFFPIPTPP